MALHSVDDSFNTRWRYRVLNYITHNGRHYRIVFKWF